MKKTFQLCLALVLVMGAAMAQATHKHGTRAVPQAKKAAATENEESRFKAIWEPVNYKEDLSLTDVFFVDDQNGWVSGENGTVLHTSDGGDSWTAQLGGDPQNKDQAIHDLRFIDGKHGWAHQGSGHSNKLLRTTDGESWEQIGKLGGNYGYGSDYFFTTPTAGFQLRDEPFDIAKTVDGGKTWKPVLPQCAAKMEIDGLTKEVGCKLKSLHFPSQNVGYAVGTGSKALFVERTDDGGESWKTSVTPDVATGDSTYFRQEVFFGGENNGFIAMNDGKILATTDGGTTWHGVVGSSKAKIKFADPSVGWSFNDSKLTYTTNGGKSWLAREFRFPTQVKAFSFPSRRRAYVIGNHGMIYRYRVVPSTYSAKGMIDAPMM